MPKIEDHRIPAFTCRDNRIIKNVIREIGKEDFEKCFATLGKETPKKLHGFHIEFRSGKFSLYYQWVASPTFLMDVTQYVHMSENWSLMMHSI